MPYNAPAWIPSPATRAGFAKLPYRGKRSIAVPRNSLAGAPPEAIIDNHVKLDSYVKNRGASAMVGVRQFDEDRLLGQALEVFWRKGLRGTSMQDLANATGVLRGSLYNAYGDKDALFLLAFDLYAARFLESARAALSNPDPRQALLAFFDIAIANMTEGSPSKGCLTTKTATEGNPAAEDIQQRLRTLLDELQAIVRSALSSEGARKRLTLDPSEAALVVVTFTRGLAVMERVYQNRKRLRDAANALVRTLTIDKGARSPRPRGKSLR